MTKKEIQQILEQGWAERRAKLKERAARKNIRTKEWLERESQQLNDNKKRQSHYIK